MMYFGNTEVVPVYYCTFTLFSIVGGSITYKEFAGLTAMQGVFFGIGILCALSGVVCITSGRAEDEGLLKERDSGVPKELSNIHLGGVRRHSSGGWSRVGARRANGRVPYVEAPRGVATEKSRADLEGGMGRGVPGGVEALAPLDHSTPPPSLPPVRPAAGRSALAGERAGRPRARRLIRQRPRPLRLLRRRRICAQLCAQLQHPPLIHLALRLRLLDAAFLDARAGREDGRAA